VRFLFALIYSLLYVLFGMQIEMHAAPLFRLRGEVIEAVQGGPVIIKATLAYQGNEEIEMRQMCYHNAEIRNAKNWRFRLKAYPIDFVGISVVGYATIAPGATFTEYLVVHDHCDAPAGKCNVDLTWSLHGMKDKKGEVISDPSTRLVVNVLPATAENLVALCDRLVKCVRQPKQSEVNPELLADMVLFTKHRALLPAAFEMLETGNPHYPVFDLVAHIYALSPSANEVQGRMVNLVRLLDWKHGKLSLFWYWQSKKMILPAEEMRRLMDNSDVWIRVLTYEAFGQKCDPIWVRRLLAELREVANPLPKGQFVRLLSELDDDRFRVRERATTKLIADAIRVEAQLKRCTQAGLSPETARRVKQILATIADRRPFSPPSLVLTGLSESPESQAILHALSNGAPGTWLTDEAKKLLLTKPMTSDSKR
jgi:hypothetical protein